MPRLFFFDSGRVEATVAPRGQVLRLHDAGEGVLLLVFAGRGACRRSALPSIHVEWVLVQDDVEGLLDARILLSWPSCAALGSKDALRGDKDCVELPGLRPVVVALRHGDLRQGVHQLVRLGIM